MKVQVVYALPREQHLVTLDVPEGATVREAVSASGMLARYPELDLEGGRYGIYGRLVKLDTPLRQQDRVEIYRPLLADPKAVRRQRAAEGKTMKRGAGEAADAAPE